jgi:GTPase
MIKIKASIQLFKDIRKTPFKSGYRPVFDFTGKMRTSGLIELINCNEFAPGDKGYVKISFLSKKYLGENFGVGTIFTFSEGGEPLGEGEVKEIY